MLQRYIRALADPSVIVLIIPREWHPLGAVARMGSVPSFLVIALRTANRHFWCRCWELTTPRDCAKKCQQAPPLKASIGTAPHAAEQHTRRTSPLALPRPHRPLSPPLRATASLLALAPAQYRATGRASSQHTEPELQRRRTPLHRPPPLAHLLVLL